MIEEVWDDTEVLPQILAHGYSRFRLANYEAAALGALYERATEFFAREDKDDFSVDGLTDAYRPFAAANTPTGPDLNDSYLHWQHRDLLAPDKRVKIAEFRRALRTYLRYVRGLVWCVIADLLAHYQSKSLMRFEKASVLQVNSFLRPVDRELYQFPHEDADFLTVIWASHPGLELVLPNGTVEPVDFARDQVLVMPGSLLTAMTDDQIQPCYHQVRNHGNPHRKSIMYFVSPEATRPIEPFVSGARYTAEDIQRLVVDNPQTQFGLAADFVA